MRTLKNSLGDWINLKYGDQSGLAEKLGVTRAAVSAYKTGRNDIPMQVQAALRKLGYTGPWPREEAQDAAAGGPAPYVTREEFAEEKGALRAEIRLLREALEKMGEAVRELALRDQERSGPRGR